jgi:hypothetical protein
LSCQLGVVVWRLRKDRSLERLTLVERLLVERGRIALTHRGRTEALNLERLEVENLRLVFAQNFVDVTGFLAFLRVESQHASHRLVEEITVFFTENAQKSIETSFVYLIWVAGVD